MPVLVEHDNLVLHRIKALKDFGNVKAGELGGWIESEENLSQDDTAWVFDNAKVSGKALVYGNAKIHNNAWVFGNAKVYGNAIVTNNAWIFNDASVYDNAYISNDAKIYSREDYIVFKNFWSSGRYFTWTRSNNKWTVGCFYGTGEELIKKAYADSKKSGREYERVVRYVESILADEQKDKQLT